MELVSQPISPSTPAKPAAAIPAEVRSGPRTRLTMSARGICIITVQLPVGTVAAA